MATLGDLKSRIRRETQRDDIQADGESAAQLDLAISSAIEYYQGERFWFKYGLGTANTVPSTPTVDLPSSVRIADTITLPSGRELIKQQIEEFLCRPSTGEPTHYAEYGAGVYLWPTPASAQTLTFYGVKNIDPPASDGESNAWTTEAYDLIAAHARFTLYRDLFRDPEGATMAQGAVTEALDRLKNETAKRNDTPLKPLDSDYGQRRYNYFGYY